MRFGSSLFVGHSRLVFWLLSLLFAGWVLLGTNTISDFLTFCLSGTIPGTKYVVPSNVVMIASMVGLGVSLVSIFGNVYVKHLKRRSGQIWKKPQMAQNYQLVQSVGKVHDVTPIVQLPASVTERPSRERTRNPYGSKLHIKLITLSWQRYFSDRLGGSALVIYGGIIRMTAGILIFAARLFVISLMGAGLSYRFVARALKGAWAASTAISNYLEPHLWAMDSWLEQRFTAAKKTLSQRLNHFIASHDVTSTLQHAIKTLYDDLFASNHKSRKTDPALAEKTAEISE